MKKKDYILLAQAIKELKESGVTNGSMLEKIVRRFLLILSPMLKKDRCEFDEDEFIKYIYETPRKS